MITDVQFTEAGAARFTQWAEDVGNGQLIVANVRAEALEQFWDALSIGSDPSYELRQMYTWRKIPEVYFPDMDELVITEAPDDDD